MKQRHNQTHSIRIGQDKKLSVWATGSVIIGGALIIGSFIGTVVFALFPGLI